MKKTMFFVLFSIIFIGIVVCAPLNIIGTWKIENQFKSNLDSIILSGPGLEIFKGEENTKPLQSFTFLESGMASISLVGGEKVIAFYRAEEDDIYLQPQGGKDTMIYIQPITGGMALAAMNWRYPAGEYYKLILILSKQ